MIKLEEKFGQDIGNQVKALEKCMWRAQTQKEKGQETTKKNKQI